MKAKKKAAAFKSTVCIGKDGLWKLLEDFQKTQGKAIQVGVVGKFWFQTSASTPTSQKQFKGEKYISTC